MWSIPVTLQLRSKVVTSWYVTSGTKDISDRCTVNGLQWGASEWFQNDRISREASLQNASDSFEPGWRSIWALTTMGGERGNEVANIWTVESVFSCLSRWDEWGVQYVCLFGFHAWATKWTVAPLIQKEEQVWRVLANVSVTHKTWGMRLS